MVRTGARAMALGHLLGEIGFEPAEVSLDVPRTFDLSRDGFAALLELYRSLGGQQREPTLRPGVWGTLCSAALSSSSWTKSCISIGTAD